MPAWGRRQSYPAVVGTMTALVGVFVVTAWLRPSIPEPEPNPIVVHRGEFMANASRQRVKWRSLEDRPFAEARRSDRLIVMVVGCGWNWQARQFDHNVLLDTEVAERLNREFVPVRIDASVRPEWESGPFPLTSAALGTDPGWYILVLRPDGRPLILIAKDDARQVIESPLFQSLLTKAEQIKRKGSADVDSEFSRQTSAEAALLLGEPDSSGGDLGQYAAKVAQRADNDVAFVEGGLFHWHPWEWRFLVSIGLRVQAESGLRTALATPMVDWLYGGLFRTDSDPGPTGVKFEKLALENAEMACVFALLSQRSGDEGLRFLARHTFDSVVRQFTTEKQVFGFSYTDAETMGRNPMYSVRPRLIAANFPPNDLQWLQKQLGLRVDSNPAMVVRVANLDDYVKDKSRYEAAFETMRTALNGLPPKPGGEDLAPTVCSVCARLIEAARVLGDKDRLKTAEALYPKAASYHVGLDSVVHSLNTTPDMVSYLGDYTAFADASLQKFLVSGDEKVLAAGENVLLRATALFGLKRDGVIGSVPVERALRETSWLALPNVVDGSRGSLVGDYTRLAEAYSLVSRDRASGKKLRERALTTVGQYSVLTKKFEFRLGDLAHAMVQVSQDVCLVVVGPDSVEQAVEVSKEAGDVVVVPALGLVRRDVQSHGPGIYVCRQDSIGGPLTPEAALASVRESP